MPDDKTQTLADGFALGILDRAEMEEFARRLSAGDQSAAEALREAQRVLAALPDALPPQPPPSSLKQKVMRALWSSAENPPSPRVFADAGAAIRPLPQRRVSPLLFRTLAWAAGSLILALGLGYLMKQRGAIQELRQERQALLQQVDRQQHQLRELEAALAFHVNVEKALQKPRVTLVDLSAPQRNHTGRGKVIFDREERRAYFISFDLPSLPDDQDYQLWHIGKAGAVDGGVFRVDQSGYSAIQVLNLSKSEGEIAAFAVTREPKGGSVNPTLTQMYLLGKV